MEMLKQGPFDFLKPLARAVATVFIAGIGMFVCTTVGSLAFPVNGVGAIGGAIAGGVFFLIIGCIVTCSWRDCMPDSEAIHPLRLLPEPFQVAMGGHGPFTLILTIHEAKSIHVHGRLPWSAPNLYCEVLCGKNPEKRTCVKKEGTWNEQFRLDIGVADRNLIIRLKDQDYFGSSDVGYVSVDIIADIIDATPPFPHRKEFQVQGGDGDTLRFVQDEKAGIILTFDNIGYNTKTAESTEEARSRYEYESKVKEKWNGGNYGAVNYLSTMQFNPTHQNPTL